MSNTILTSGGLVSGPPYPEPAEESPMADEAVFPRWYYAAQVPAGRVFETQEALDAARAEGPWYTSPTEAADAAAKATTVTEHQDATEGESPTRRSHR